MLTSEAVTRNVRVRVSAKYDPERSNIPAGQWFFQYTVDISNEGTEPFAGPSPCIIPNAVGVQEVKAPRVGPQPVSSRSKLEYTSGWASPHHRSMHGTYQMPALLKGIRR